MPLINRISEEEIATEFVYYGWLFGLVPVYVGELNEDNPVISTRNGVPEFWMDFCEVLFAGFCYFATFINNQFEPAYPIRLTGRVDGKPLD